MRTWVIAVGVAGLLLGLVSSSRAQWNDRVYPIFELTDEDVALIDLHDGSIWDWEEAVGEATLTGLDFVLYPEEGHLPDAGAYDPASMDLRMWLAWHRSTSRIYVAMERADDLFFNKFNRGNSDPEYSFPWLQDSCIQVMVDGDHSGGQYTTSSGLMAHTQTQGYWALAEVYDDGPQVELVGGPLRQDWFVRPPYAEGGGGVFGENPTISVTEFYVTAFDRLVVSSEEESGKNLMSQLYPGQTIGLLIVIPDWDDPRILRQPPFRLYLGDKELDGACCFSDNFADFFLLGPGGEIPDDSAVERITWGRIKAQFVK